MADTGRQVEPLPDEFASEEEAARFWEAHSLTDYEEFLEPADVQLDLKRRHFEIEVDEASFLALRDAARRQDKPVSELASEILSQNLAVR